MTYAVWIEVPAEHPEARDQPILLQPAVPGAGGLGEGVGPRQGKPEEARRDVPSGILPAQNAASGMAIIAALPPLMARNRPVAWGRTRSMKKRALIPLAS